MPQPLRGSWDFQECLRRALEPPDPILGTFASALDSLCCLVVQCDLDEVKTNDQHGDEVATVKSDAYYCHLTLDFDSCLWVVTGRESRLLSNSYVFHSRFFIQSVPIHCFHSFSSFSLLPFIYFSVYGVCYVLASLLSM